MTTNPIYVPGYIVLCGNDILTTTKWGGTALLVKNNMAEYICDIDITCCDQIWLRVSFMPNMIFGGCYIPPSDSPYYDDRPVLSECRKEMCRFLSWVHFVCLPYSRDTAMYRECFAYVRTLAPVAGVSGGDRWLHPTVLCGMQLLVRAWDVCVWCQIPQMLTLIFMILILTILDAKWIDLFRGSHSAPVAWPAVRLPERKCAHFCSGWCIVGCLAGALWDGWDWSITITV